MNARFALAAGLLALALSLNATAATQDAIAYVSGGIGHDEAVALEREAKNYPLSLFFSGGKRNEFLADVRVTIKDKAGNVVLDSVSSGPIMLVRLPAGEYSISARNDTPGPELHRKVRVTASGDKRIDFHWLSA